MASRSLKNDQHADAGSPRDQNAKAQAETPAHHPTKQDGEPAGDLTRNPAMTFPRPPRAPRPGCASARPGREPALPLSVWATAQKDARTQRRGRYLPAATAHPAKMLPAIAATAITRYSEPGDLVADPMCGIGTTLVEAIHLGRDAIGIEYEPRWAHIAAANITCARRQDATGEGEVIRGDARQLPALLPAGMAGRVALVVTSPPYGCACRKPRPHHATRRYSLIRPPT